MVVPVLMICCSSITAAPKTGPGKQYDSCPFFEAAHVDHIFRVANRTGRNGATNGRLNVPFGVGVAEGKCSLANSMCSPAIPLRNSRLR